MRVGAKVGIALAVTVFALLAFVPSGLHRIPGHGHRPAYAAAVASAMAVLWLFEALPIWITACIPLVAYPLLGVFGQGPLGDVKRSAEPFVDAYVILFLGGMALGAAMEAWSLHRRIALHVMRKVGTSPRRLLLGVIVATASLSLWISNTATAVMMMPIGVALLQQLEASSRAGGEERKLDRYGTSVMLAVAYASNVGGIGTKIGTGTNSIFCGFVKDKLGFDIPFLKYMAFGVPFVVIMVPIVWGVLWLHGRSDPALQRDAEGDAREVRQVIERSLAEMGPPSPQERRVASIFFLAATLWVFGDPIRSVIVPRIAPLVKRTFGVVIVGKHYEAAVGVLAAMLLVVLGVLGRDAIRRIPWSTLVLLGGSFAMAAGIEGSGLAAWMAMKLAGVARLPLGLQVLVATASSVVLTAVASNTATINVALNVLPRSMPVLSASALAASCDFALPAGTPPNAIVFGSGYVRLSAMIRIGVVLDFISILLITLYVLVYAQHVL